MFSHGDNALCLRPYPPLLPLLASGKWYTCYNPRIRQHGRMRKSNTQNMPQRDRTGPLSRADIDSIWLMPARFFMMTSSNGNIFRITDQVCREFTGDKGQWRGALMFSLICVWINGWVKVYNHEAGDLRRYRAHYDVTVMSNCNMFTRIFTSI